MVKIKRLTQATARRAERESLLFWHEDLDVWLSPLEMCAALDANRHTIGDTGWYLRTQPERTATLRAYVDFLLGEADRSDARGREIMARYADESMRLRAKAADVKERLKKIEVNKK